MREKYSPSGAPFTLTSIGPVGDLSCRLADQIDGMKGFANSHEAAGIAVSRGLHHRLDIQIFIGAIPEDPHIHGQAAGTGHGPDAPELIGVFFGDISHADEPVLDGIIIR